MNIPLGKNLLTFIIIMGIIFMYVSADVLFGAVAEGVKSILIAYILMLLAILAVFGKKIPELRLEEAPKFILGFLIMGVAMLSMFLVIPQASLFVASLEFVGVAVAFGSFHLVKAFIEELVFRGILPMNAFAKIPSIKGIPGNIWADIFSSVIFGAFHFAALTLVGAGTNWFGLIFLMIIGFVFAMFRRGFGLMGATGAHFAYNLAALGILGGILGIGLI